MSALNIPAKTIAAIMRSHMLATGADVAHLALDCRMDHSHVKRILDGTQLYVTEATVDRLLVNLDRQDEWHTTLAGFWQAS